MMNTFSIRFTPQPVDLSGITDFSFDYLNRYEKFILAREDKDKQGQSVPVHYHIYVETTYGEATIRQTTKEALRLPAAGRGKNNGYYSLIPNWKDPGYICKYNDIQTTKGYTEKELLDFVISGKKKYLHKMEKSPAENSVTAETKSKPTAKTPRIPYQQQIISIAAADWYNHKKRLREENACNADAYDLPQFVMKAMREVSRGINEYLLQDICNAILYDDLDFRERTLERIKSKLKL